VGRLADRLAVARQLAFVGREPEMGLFKRAIAAAELPFQVLYVHGPGGVGKTSLLRQFGYTCLREDLGFVYVDGRDVEPTTDALARALEDAIGGLQDQRSDRRRVVALDTCETLAALDGWLRDSFLPAMPSDTLVVLAGREPPSSAWRADPGWQLLLKSMPLRNLSRDEAEAYL